MNNVLYFFTQSYPYGSGESFIENELNFIASKFKQVYLFTKSKESKLRTVPGNVELVYIEPSSLKRNVGFLIKNIFIITYILFTEVFFSRQKKMFRKKIRYNVSYLITGILYAEAVYNFSKDKKDDKPFFYSYWFFDWNFSLAVLKFKNKIKCNFTRAHGFDLYEDNGKPNYLPFRKFCFDNTDKIFTVSKTGANYLKNIYPHFSNKIKCYYLGTLDMGINPLPDNNTPIHIVSCSNIVSVKRVELIIDVLKYCKVDIIWTHIGDGILKEVIVEKSKSLPANCKANFLGSLSQQAIFNFYNTTPIDIFINCSISEGLPVGIMEAISFGIPVIATDVGGTKEIVTKETGFLLTRDFDFKGALTLILSVRNTFIRENIKSFWKQSFSSKKNNLMLLYQGFEIA